MTACHTKEGFRFKLGRAMTQLILAIGYSHSILPLAGICNLAQQRQKGRKKDLPGMTQKQFLLPTAVMTGVPAVGMAAVGMAAVGMPTVRTATVITPTGIPAVARVPRPV